VSAISTYFAMGGYGVYVWPAYGLATAVLGGLALDSWRRYRDGARRLAHLQQQVGSRR
jgi:heme exporter protein CcmD